MIFAAARRVVAPGGPSSLPRRLCVSHVAARRLLSTLAILEQRGGQLSHGSLSALTAAKHLGGSVHGFLAGEKVKDAAQEAAKVEGVEKIVAVDNSAYDKVTFQKLETMRGTDRVLRASS